MWLCLGMSRCSRECVCVCGGGVVLSRGVWWQARRAAIFIGWPVWGLCSAVFSSAGKSGALSGGFVRRGRAASEGAEGATVCPCHISRARRRAGERYRRAACHAEPPAPRSRLCRGSTGAGAASVVALSPWVRPRGHPPRPLRKPMRAGSERVRQGGGGMRQSGIGHQGRRRGREGSSSNRDCGDGAQGRHPGGQRCLQQRVAHTFQLVAA